MLEVVVRQIAATQDLCNLIVTVDENDRSLFRQQGDCFFSSALGDLASSPVTVEPVANNTRMSVENSLQPAL